jgi:hypothetical protein
MDSKQVNYISAAPQANHARAVFAGRVVLSRQIAGVVPASGSRRQVFENRILTDRSDMPEMYPEV